MNEPIKIFISYAHEDDWLRKELVIHLANAINQKLIEIWHDREIRAGSDWAKEIEAKLELADLILFLVSPNFINSQYCSGIEMAKAIERHQAKMACAIPVIVREIDWTSTPLGILQAIPRDNRHVTKWGHDQNSPTARDEPWQLVNTEIKRVAREIRDKRIAELQAKQKAQARQKFQVKAQDIYQNHYHDGELALTAKRLLERDRKRLDLDEQDAQEILSEIEAECQHRQANLAEYREAFSTDLGDRSELTANQRRLLQQFQADLDISDEEAQRIEQEVLAEKAAERARKPTTLLQTFPLEIVQFDRAGQEESRTDGLAQYFVEFLPSGIDLSMAYIPAGNFQMGSADAQGDADERPRHQVTVPAFLMGKYPVTQAQWRVVAALPPVKIAFDATSHFQGNNRPMESISWNEAEEFCQRLSRHTNRAYRLPSEAEWEYACRVKTTTEFYFGDTLTAAMANHAMSVGETSVVGNYLPNAFGLYDLHGNVWEWCADHWHGNYQGAPLDGTAWLQNGDSDRRVIRGGSWFYRSSSCRAADRNHISANHRDDDVGFRVVCAVFPGLL